MGMQPPALSDILSSEETAAEIKVRPRTLESWRRRGFGPPFVRVSSRCIRYHRDDIERWLTARRVGSDGAK
jgi:hypothetical protein